MLEKEFAELVGVKYAITIYCGTHDLHFATIFLRFKPVDEMIVTEQKYWKQGIVFSTALNLTEQDIERVNRYSGYKNN